MDELLDMIATDASATDISDSIKDTLYAKAAERIQSQKPDIAMQMFDPTTDDEVSDEPVDSMDDSTEEEEEEEEI